MSYESLSQNEIDRLFSSDGDPAPAERAKAAAVVDVQVYDFKRPARISKDRHRSLQAIYTLCGKSFESWLTGRTRDASVNELEHAREALANLRRRFSLGEIDEETQRSWRSVFDVDDE